MEKKKKRRRNYRGTDYIWNFYINECFRTSQQRLKGLQTLANMFCDKLKLKSIPQVYLCDVKRQNDCIRRCGGIPCGGGCYQHKPPVIYMRHIFSGYNTLLEELYHHVNTLNNGKAIKTIMMAWTENTFGDRQGYGKILKKHKIMRPMK